MGELEIHAPRPPGSLIVRAASEVTPTAFSAEADISGLSITFVAPATEVRLRVQLPTIGQNTTAGRTTVKVTDAANTEVRRVFDQNITNAQFASPNFTEARITGLTVGTSYTYKLRIVTSAGTASFFAAANMPAFIEAVTAP